MALRARLLGGWQVSGITSFFSGQSFSLAQPHDPWDPNGLNVGLGIGSPRPDQIAPVQKTKTVGAWFSTSSFAPALNHFGSESNGSLLGPGYNNWDLAAIKNITFHGALQLPTPRRVLQRLQPRKLLRASTVHLPIAALAR